jgi:hypothetical protein
VAQRLLMWSRMTTVAMLKILVLDDSDSENEPTLTAQYNPKEVQIEHAVPWKARTDTGKSAPADLEFTSREPQTMSLELLFDASERGDVTPCLQALRSLTEARPKEKRPPLVQVLWGNVARAMPKFTGVVEKVSIKYQMFGTDGAVLRATANVNLKEIDLDALRKRERDAKRHRRAG